MRPPPSKDVTPFEHFGLINYGHIICQTCSGTEDKLWWGLLIISYPLFYPYSHTIIGWVYSGWADWEIGYSAISNTYESDRRAWGCLYDYSPPVRAYITQWSLDMVMICLRPVHVDHIISWTIPQLSHTSEHVVVNALRGQLRSSALPWFPSGMIAIYGSYILYWCYLCMDLSTLLIVYVNQHLHNSYCVGDKSTCTTYSSRPHNLDCKWVNQLTF